MQLKKIDNIVEKVLDGKSVAIMEKAEGIAVLTPYNIYSSDMQKLIRELNKCPNLMTRPLAENFWNTKLVPVEACLQTINKLPENRKERLNTVTPSSFLMELRMFYC